MNREKFPEKIPFRLTRMLTNAMEVLPLIQVSYSFIHFVIRLLELKETSV